LFVFGLLAGEASAALFLLAGEGAFTFDLRQQVALVGDFVDDVIDEVEQVFRGKRPRRRRGDERLLAWSG
jgi:hypothetical protein